MISILLLCVGTTIAGDTADTGFTPAPTLESELSLLTEEYNHLLPYNMALDHVGRRLYVLSMAYSTMAVVDVDSAELVGVYRTEVGTSSSRIQIGDQGQVWIWSKDILRRFDPIAETFEDVAPLGHSEFSGIIDSSTGVTLIGGRSFSGDEQVVALDEDDAIFHVEPLNGASSHIEAVGANWIAAHDHSIVPSLFISYETIGFSEVDSCSPPLEPTSWLALDDGTFAMVTEQEVAWLDCDGSYSTRTEGLSNQALVDLGMGRFAVLDKSSDAAAYMSEARIYELGATAPPSLALVDTWPTGLTTPDGVYDPIDELIWLSAENASQALALDPSTGRVVHEVPLGQHIEGVAYDPDEDGRLFVTGRLSNKVSRMELDESGALEVTAEVEITWASVPVMADGDLWVFAQLEGELIKLDPETLGIEARIVLPSDPGEKNLVFSDLEYNEERGTLFVSWSPEAVLMEFDPSDGKLLNTWDISMGVSPNIEGRLEILFSDELVYVVRSNDGEMARIDMDADTVTTADNLESLMPSKIELQYSALSEDGGTLFVGANAVDSETLEVDEDQERSWYLAFGQEGSCTLGLTVDNQIASYDADGDLLWSFDPGFARTQQTLYSVWIPEWSAIAIQDMGTATVQLWRVEEACPGE